MPLHFPLTRPQKIVVVAFVITVFLTLLAWFALWWSGVLHGFSLLGIHWALALLLSAVLFTVVPKLTSFTYMVLGIWTTYTSWHWWFIASVALYVPTISVFVNGLVYTIIASVFEVLLNIVNLIFGKKNHDQ